MWPMILLGEYKTYKTMAEREETQMESLGGLYYRNHGTYGYSS